MLNLDDIKPRTMEFAIGGRQYAIPTIDSLDADTIVDVIEGGAGSVEYIKLFRGVLAKHAPEALGSMTVAQMNALLKEWQKTGNAGESSPSSD